MGPSIGVGNEYCSWILKPNGKVIARRTLRSLTHIEQSSPVELRKIQHFDHVITKKYGDGIHGPQAFDMDEINAPLDFDDYRSESEDNHMEKRPKDADGKNINNKFIDVDVRMLHNEEITRAKVTGRTVFDNGQTSGTYHDNPYHNTLVYDVTFPIGTVKEYAASLIADNMVNQVDKDSFEFNLLELITDHQKPRDALSLDDEQLMNNEMERVQSDDGWYFQILWTDGNKE